MAFPKETWEWADQKAKEIKKKYACTKFGKAYGLYEELALPYGFLDNIKEDNWAPWPHELKTVTCQTSASIVYVVAKQLGLNPALKAAAGVRNNADEPHGIYHLFVEVDVGAKKPLIVDPSRKMFGYIRYDNDTARVRDNRFTTLLKFEYSSLWTLTEEEYATKLEHQRTRKGKLNVLAEGQFLGQVPCDNWKSRLGWETWWYVKYNPEESTIETRLCYGRHSYLHYRILENKIHIQDGKVTKRELHCGTAKSYNWWALEDPKHYATIDFQIINNIGPTAWKLKRAEHTTLEKVVQAQMLNKPMPQASKNVEETAKTIVELSNTAYQTFRTTANKQELRRLLSEASYQRARNGTTVFTHKELTDYCQKEFDKYTKEGLQSFRKAHTANLHASGIQTTPRSIEAYRHNRRRMNNAWNTVNTLCKLHTNDATHRFEAIIDRHLYAKKIKKKTLQPEQFTEQELQSAYATILTEYIILAAHARKLLNLQGIEKKILKAIKQAKQPLPQEITQEVLAQIS